MKSNIQLLLAMLILFISCKEKQKDTESRSKAEVSETFLPFQSIDLNNISSFEDVSGNWKIKGNVYVDRSEDKVLNSTSGTGILVNIPEEGKTQNLFTNFEHGDIELELDVMMPKGSNSGLYFQGRYEVQLFDSWGVKEPDYVDMGGIYERWDTSKEKGKEGYEGHPPKINAAKAPGLWQHLKVIFHAPKFDSSGNKTKNGWFEEVWLNGVLIQENIEVTGPTRAAAFEDEKPKAALMIQGDHGPVAFKNIKYKLYSANRITLEGVNLRAYESGSKIVSNLDSLELQYSRKTDSISPVTIVDRMGQTILEYTGNMTMPIAGDYLFEMKVDGGAALLIDTDTLINMNGDYRMDSLGIGKISLQRAAVPFKLIYNKHTPWRRGFQLYVEGPNMQRYSLQEPSALTADDENTQNFDIRINDQPITQRSFWMHEGKKRTHCISVGMPQGIHYSYDLEAGTLLQLWDGDFMDATQMWLARGEKQLGAPKGFIVSLHGDPEFALLETEKMPWPDNLSIDSKFKQLGYEFDAQGLPFFSNQFNGIRITQRIVPSKTQRKMKRVISTDGDKEVWYKIADGESIEMLPDGTYIVNDESYFVDFSGTPTLTPEIRNSLGKDELLVKIPIGKQNIEYSLIW